MFRALAEAARRLYPGWRLRIYHNVTSEDTEALNLFCQLYCNYSFIDLCDTRDLPVIGDLNSQFPNGMFWRFQPLADPTVEIFGNCYFFFIIIIVIITIIIVIFLYLSFFAEINGIKISYISIYYCYHGR